MQYNISPETLRETRHPSSSVERLLRKECEIDGDYAVCANGAQYRKDVRGFLPELMEKIYNERVIFKKRMLTAKQEYENSPSKKLEKEIARCNNIQMAKKIQLNSAYGAIGNNYFRYYKLENAEAITLSGQFSIRWIEGKMNAYLNKLLKTDNKDYVIASDTDSIYLNLGHLVQTIFGQDKDVDKTKIVNFLDKACQEQFEPFIEKSYAELAAYVNAYEQKMFMKRENIADRGIWTAKKRYILNVWDSEGVRYENPKLKVMGIEAVLPDGSIFTDLKSLRKNNTGYDLKQLFIGAEGTLGVITKVSLRLSSSPKREISSMVSLKSVDDAINLLKETKKRFGDNVTAFEFISQSCLVAINDFLSHIKLPLGHEDSWQVIFEIINHSEDDLSEFLEKQLSEGLITNALIAKNEKERKFFNKI